ncbi:MAG: dehydrogenase [Gemmatimonadota bacterium]|nr:MAG: dehydrogenase [Gemmatimonadota bacterium]
MSARLDGKVALVTGGGTGIGRAIASALAEAGARVVVAGRREEPLRATVSALGGRKHAHAVTADVSRPADRERLLAETVDAFGGLDVLVNNAGTVASVGPLAEVTEDDWNRMLSVNVTAPVFLARAALPLLRPRRGSILNISTGASLKPVPGFAAYGASKAALNYACQVLALEAAPDVRVNIICPGGVDTPIYGTFLSPDQIESTHQFFRESTPLGRMGKPTDVAEAALFLTSEAAAWITGTTLVVDGGLNLG